MNNLKSYLKLRCSQFPMLLSSKIKRDHNLYVFGAWFGEKYADNSKALFEYMLKHYPWKKAIWITKNKSLLKNLKKEKIPAVYMRSFIGIYLQCRAKVVFFCTGVGDVTCRFLGGATHINLWHGVGGGKKIGYDASWGETYYEKEFIKLQKRYFKDTYYVCTSDEMKKVFKSAFRVDDEHIIMAGQPRNDIFYYPNYTIKSFSINQFANKKVICYLPTHRKDSNSKIQCSKIFDLKRLNHFCELHGIIFIIKKHYYHMDEIEDLSNYPMILDWTSRSEIDTNELLMVTNLLITDYSSVSADYLLLNRPIVYYCYDLDHYISKDRDLYWPFDSITPGRKVFCFDQLFEEIKTIITDGQDKYSEERIRVRNMFYGEQARKEVCSDILAKVETLIS